MLSRGIAIVRCFQWVFHPASLYGSLPPLLFRVFSSGGPSSPPNCFRAKKVDFSQQRTLSEVILYSLTHVAATTRFKPASPEPSEKEAIREALRILGLENHIQDFVGNPATLPFIRKVQLLLTEKAAHSDVKTLLTTRAFLAVSSDKLVAVHNLLKSFFSKGESASKVLAQNAGILLQSLEHLERKFQCLNDFEVGEVACWRICTSSHHILTLELEGLESRLSFLQKIGLTNEARDRLLRKFPQVLKLSVEKKLQPTVEYFAREGMSSSSMLKMLCLHPEFLGLSIDKNLALKMDMLKQLGLTPQERCKAIGSLAQCSCQGMAACYNALRHRFSADNVNAMIRKQPDILGRSMDCTMKKLDHFINVEKRDLQEIMWFPACLNYSLERRIVPRFNILKEKNLPSKCSMSSILAIKPEVFRKRFNIPQSVQIG